MKKIFFNVTACICAGLLFAGCNKDDEDNDNLTNESGAWNGILMAANVEGVPDGITIDAVKAFMGNYEVGSGMYKNGGFTLTLSSLPDEALYPFQLFDGITVSPADAKGYFALDGFSVYAYKDRNQIGEFKYWYRDDTSEMELIIMYADKDVEVTGTVPLDSEGKTAELNLSLKKGWNKTYGLFDEYATSLKVTTKKQNGLKWYLDHRGN